MSRLLLFFDLFDTEKEQFMIAVDINQQETKGARGSWKTRQKKADLEMICLHFRDRAFEQVEHSDDKTEKDTKSVWLKMGSEMAPI